MTESIRLRGDLVSAASSVCSGSMRPELAALVDERAALAHLLNTEYTLTDDDPVTIDLAGLDPWAFSPRTGSVGIHVFGARSSPASHRCPGGARA